MDSADVALDSHYQSITRYPDKGRTSDKRLEVERQLSTRWSREELEDKYLRLYGENQELRESNNKQQDKIKNLTTKLERLFQDRKKLLAGEDVSSQGGGAVSFNVQELQDRVVALQAQNAKLKAKVDVLTNQLKNQPKGSSAFQTVSSKINTGLPKPEPSSLSKTVHQSASGMRSISPLVPKATRQMIDDLRSENTQLRAEMIRLQQNLEEANGKVDDGKKKLAEASAQYQEDLARIKQTLGSDQRNSIKANIEQINMQRDLKDKTAKLQITSEKLRQLEAQVEQFKINEQQLRREVDKLQGEVVLERERRTHISEELKSTSAVARAAPELETKLSDIARENIILKETNEKLTQSAFDVDRERGLQNREQSYRIQLQQMEATLKADVGEKSSILEKLNEERASADKIRQELKDERARSTQLKQEVEAMQDKMKIFSKASAVDFDELGEALMLIRERKRSANAAASESSVLKSTALHSAANAQDGKDWKKLYEDLEIVQAETVNELDRTRAILSVQYRINKDYAQEVEATTRRLESMQTESESRLQEYAKLLDLRLARIRKLEARLRDLAYGVRPLRPIAMVSTAGFEDIEQKGELEAGQNLFEIHLDTLRISSDTLRLLNEAEMAVFCTWGFFEFELQKSPVVRSYNGSALFDCTSQYIVTVDDFFLSYLAHRPFVIELHRSRGGLDYETIAAARVSLKELLESQEPTCRMAGTVPFTGLSGALEAIQVGELEFWVLLRVPMQNAFRLFRERLKAMNYLVSDVASRDAALAAMETGSLAKAATAGENVNILHVHIIRCQGLRAFGSAPNQPIKRQPSSYVAYKLLDYPEHVSATVPDSAAPQFNDHHTFTLYTTADTDRFLKTESLQLFVFDDVAPETDAIAYLGRARVPLISLTNNQPVQGLFELTRADGTASGVIEVRLSWQFPYRQPTNLTLVPPPKIGPDPEMPEVPVRDIDVQVLQRQLQQAARPQTSQLLGKTVQTQQLQADLPHPAPVSVAPIMEPTPPPPVAPPVSNVQLLPDVTPAPLQVLPSPVPPVQPSPVPPTSSALSPPVASAPSTSPAPPSVVSEATKDNKSESSSQPDVVFESDSEGVVVETSRLPKSVRQSLEQSVSITIQSLRIKADSSIAKDDKITQLFVAFDFGSISQGELETPLSLPKPTGGAEHDLLFNFTKVIPVSPTKNAENRAFLVHLLSGGDRRARSLVFSIVNESMDSDECDDIAEALVDFGDILNKEDVREKDFEVRSLADNTVVGSLKLTIVCRDILRAIKQEMDQQSQPQDPAQSGSLSPQT